MARRPIHVLLIEADADTADHVEALLRPAAAALADCPGAAAAAAAAAADTADTARPADSALPEDRDDDDDVGLDAPVFVHRAISLSAASAGQVPPDPCVVLLDLHLPDAPEARAALAAVRRRWPAAGVVVLAGPGEEALAAQAMRSGAHDYLDKARLDAPAVARAIRYAAGRAHADAAVARERSLLRNLVDALPDQVYAKDLDGRFIVANRATQQFFGVAGEGGLIGKTDFDLFPPDAARAFRAEEQDLAAGRISDVDREDLVTPFVGLGAAAVTAGAAGEKAEEVCLRTHKAPLRDDGGRVVGTVGVNRDITERRRAREELRQANAELADRERRLRAALATVEQAHRELQATQLQLVQAEKMEAIGRLSAGVAHEVKNPLSVVLMGVDLLSRRGGNGAPAADPETADVLNTMAHAVRRATGIVRGLLDYAAPAELASADVPVRALVDDALRLIKYEAGHAHVTVRTDLPHDLPAVRVDRGKIEQVIVNLLMNAIHAMADADGGRGAGGGGTLTVRGRVVDPPPPAAAGDRPADAAATAAATTTSITTATAAAPGRLLVLDIDDTGPGIREEHLARLFEPFFTTKSPGKGTGLGLSVARTIMGLHGGALTIANRADGERGVRATLVLPVDKGV